jgi:hypothetical protein
MMPKSDPEARSTMSAKSNDAATSVKLLILCIPRTALILEAFSDGLLPAVVS